MVLVVPRIGGVGPREAGGDLGDGRPGRPVYPDEFAGGGRALRWWGAAGRASRVTKPVRAGQLPAVQHAIAQRDTQPARFGRVSSTVSGDDKVIPTPISVRCT